MTIFSEKFPNQSIEQTKSKVAFERFSHYARPYLEYGGYVYVKIN